jgi:uncharacterized membrane protein YidH (DUF202 family)
MHTIGIVLVIVGAIIFYSGMIIYKKTEKRVNEFMQEEESSDAEFLGLLNNGMLIVKIIGAIVVAVGAAFILLL